MTEFATIRSLCDGDYNETSEVTVFTIETDMNKFRSATRVHWNTWDADAAEFIIGEVISESFEPMDLVAVVNYYSEKFDGDRDRSGATQLRDDLLAVRSGTTPSASAQKEAAAKSSDECSSGGRCQED